VDPLVEQHLGDVTQQPGAVVGADDDIHRIGFLRNRAPADLNDPLRLAALKLQYRGAILAVDTDTTANGDVAHDGVTWQRLAATGHLRQQVADTLNLYVAALARLVGR